MQTHQRCKLQGVNQAPTPVDAQVKMFLPMGIMWMYNKVGEGLQPNLLRVAYGASQAFAVLAAFYIWSRVNATASTTDTVTTKTKQATGP